MRLQTISGVASIAAAALLAACADDPVVPEVDDPVEATPDLAASADCFWHPAYEYWHCSSEPAKAWVRNNRITDPSHTPRTRVSYNSAGAPNRIDRLGVGRYSVVFGNIGADAVRPGDGGTVLVSSYRNNDRCKVRNWSAFSADVVVNVDCYEGSTGAPVDAQFTALYYREGPYGSNTSASSGRNAGYAWADFAAPPAVSPIYQWNANYTSTGVAPVTAAPAGTSAVVTFEDFSLASPVGLTFVTAYGPSNGWCTKTFGSTSRTVRVNCYDGAGRLQPAGAERFTVSSIPDAMIAGRPPANAPKSVVPTHGGGVSVDPFVPDACPADPPRGIVRTQFNSVGGTNTACFDAKNNKWIVEFEGLDVGKSAMTLVSASHDPTDSGSSRYCNVVRTPLGATGPQAHVRCFNGDGTPNNLTGFTLLYLTDEAM